MHFACFGQVKKQRRMLTIFQKMEIVNYADSLESQHGRSVAKRVKGKTPAPEVLHHKKRKKGVNVQLACKQKFGTLLGGMSVFKLRQQSQKQKWHLLSESQQRRMFHLTDELKMSLGLKDSIKGWKVLTDNDAISVIDKKSKLQRWNIPGEILKAHVHSPNVLMFKKASGSNL